MIWVAVAAAFALGSLVLIGSILFEKVDRVCAKFDRVEVDLEYLRGSARWGTLMLANIHRDQGEPDLYRGFRVIGRHRDKRTIRVANVIMPARRAVPLIALPAFRRRAIHLIKNVEAHRAKRRSRSN